MSDSNSGQEKTEQATPKRLADARKKGQVPRSRELTTAAVMLASASALVLFGDGMLRDVADLLRDGLSFDRADLLEPNAPLTAFGDAIRAGLTALLPFFGIVLVAALAAPAMTGGWSFSLQALAFKIEKLNPAKGLKRVFSARGLLELAKALAKFALIGSVAVFFLRQLAGQFLALGAQPLMAALENAATLCTMALLIFSTPLLIIAAVDVPFQLWDHAKQLRMTRQEVRDEAKETDGNPEMKSRIRQLQFEQANKRMMEDVPDADVIITNPTHFAVALKYDPMRMGAPKVVAKGADLIAARIRHVARENNVPLMSAPPLARALFASTELGQEIPARMYAAVAQVLTWVYQLRQAEQAGEPAPDAPIVDYRDEPTDRKN